MKFSISKDYWRAVQVSLTFQVGFGAMAAVVADSNIFLRFWSFAMAAYWGSFLIMILLRPNRPTKVDLFLIRWGFVFVLGLAPFISGLVWRWRGVI